MKKTIYAILVVAAPLLAQQGYPCTTAGLPAGTPCTGSVPIREFGQPALLASLTSSNVNSAAPNLIVGQELYNPTAIAFDTSVSPPRVYIVDSGNNRVLGWSNAGNVIAGNFADMVLGQQPAASGGPDYTAALPWGPGTANSIGLNTPTGIAVDAAGNVYVSDSGNNRILRFVTPYKQQPGNQVVDIVIGQKSVTSGNFENQGLANPTATTLDLSIASLTGVLPAGLAIDSSGNLWAADPGNNRVLMYPQANLAPNPSGIAATVVLGQTSLTTNQLASGFTPASKNSLANPTTVGVDSNGTVYVTDSAGRALVFPSPGLGAVASTVLGLPPTLIQGQTLVYPSQSTLGGITGTSITASPQGIFTTTSGGNVTIYVCDSPQSRVVAYTSLTIPSNANSPQQTSVLGQNGYSLGQPNQGLTAPTNATFSNPVAGAIRPDNGEMWIVDQGNNRVIAFVPQTGGAFTTASRVLGQKDFTHSAANLLEGRELWFNGGGGIAFDTSVSPPYLYIADTQNNRVLGFKDGFGVGVDPSKLLTQTADLVIGQAPGDLLDNMVNYPNNAAGQPSATGLNHPIGLVVDAKGNLWVADSGNARLVRFPTPFAQTGQQTADTVLGQSSLTAYAPGVTQFVMESAFGLTMFSNGSLAVSDPQANRILVFAATGGTFTSGQGAAYVIGQSSFSQSGSGSGQNQFNSPRHMAVDSSDRLYVCDYNNYRLLLFSKPTSSNPSATGSTGLQQPPEAVAVSFATGLAWIAFGADVVQIPEISAFEQTSTALQALEPLVYANNSGIAALAVALDPFDNVVVADNSNRVTFYYPQLFYRNTANYTAGLGTTTGAGPSPNTLAELHQLGAQFNFTPSYTSTPANMAPPWSTTYSQGTTTFQVTVAGLPAPVFRVDPSGTVLIQVPNNAPSSGLADFIVANPNTGQVYAAAPLPMQQSSPGIYTLSSSGTGAVAADGYGTNNSSLGVNTSTNPVPPGGVISLWLTGAGTIANLPPDGTPPGSTPLYCTPSNPNVYIGGAVATVVGSCMSPQFPGAWQINAVIPPNAPPGPVSVVVQLNGFASNYVGTGSTTSPGADEGIPISNSLITTIYVK